MRNVIMIHVLAARVPIALITEPQRWICFPLAILTPLLL